MTSACPLCSLPIEDDDGSSHVSSCSHKTRSHAKCVEELRRFGVKTTCSACRSMASAGGATPARVLEEANARFARAHLRVIAGCSAWGALSDDESRELQGVVAMLTEVATTAAGGGGDAEAAAAAT